MTGALDGIVVTDLSRALAGPHAAMMLGDLGARVIKVENPGAGDDTRGWGPPFVGPQGAEQSTYYLSCNRNKESITLDLKSADGAQTLTGLVRNSDVLIENFRTGVLDRLGFSMRRLHEINPRLIILSITGFGHDGPEGGRAGYDQIAQGEAGLMSLTGPDAEHPTRTGVPIADLLAGMYGAYGVVAALHERDRTHVGTVVRTSLLAAVVGVHAFQGTRYTVAGEVSAPSGGHHPSVSPYGLFTCADGMLQIAVGSESLWRAFSVPFGLDRPEWTGNSARIAQRDALIDAINEVFTSYPLAELLPKLAALGIPSGEIRTLDRVYEWDQTRSQGLVIEVDHPTLGTISLPGPPLRFETPDGETHRTNHLHPPTLGEHNDSVRAWLSNVEDNSGFASTGLGG
jgi:crotonobetainyl-CoA:carnitine CoA-transferase CaiB-like acyl-CoA transferase